MRRIVYTVILGLCLAVGTAHASLFGVREFTAENGMRVLVVPNHKAPIVKLMVWYKVGSLDEPQGKGGLAHLLEHLMFRGTKQVPNSDFNDIVAKNGAIMNAFTAHDFTAYHEFSDISRLETMIALEADRMTNLSFSNEAFESERAIVAQERQQRVLNHPSAMFREEADRLLWRGASYGRPVSGVEDEIESLMPEDARMFYRTYYAPDRAVLVLAGDITKEDAKRLVDRYFGAENPAKPQDFEPFEEKVLPQTHYRLTQTPKQINTPRVMIDTVVPSFSENRDEAYALTMFAEYLSGGDNAYLNKNLVRTNKAVATDASYDGWRRGKGTFRVVIVPLPEDDAESAEKLLKETILEALENLDEAELEKIKAKIEANLVYVNDNPEESAMMVGTMATLGFSAEDIESYADRLQAVSLAEVRAVAEQMLQTATSVTGVLWPQTIENLEKR